MESTPSCSRDPTDITADCPWKRAKNRMSCGRARWFEDLSLPHCDNASGAQGVRWDRHFIPRGQRSASPVLFATIRRRGPCDFYSVSSISGSTSVATSRAGCPSFLRVGHVSVIAQSTIVGRIAFGGLGTVPFARTLLPDGALRWPHHLAHQQPSSPVSVEQLQQTDWSDAMTVLPELRQQIWHPAPAARRSREKLK